MRVRTIPMDEEIRVQLPPTGSRLSDELAMNCAFRVAWRGIGRVALNPMVGCVLLDDQGSFVAAAAHMNYGEAHAEVALLDHLKKQGICEKLKGGSLYVTLEPCAHFGKTPPCALALSQSGLREVVIARQDPNPLVNGRGIQALKDAGIKVRVLQEFAQTFDEQNRAFVHRQHSDRIFVGMKVASGIDGAMARHGDQRTWITSERARRYGHFLRLYYDGIAIAAGTLQADNPSLSPHHIKGARIPFKVIFDSDLVATRKLGLDTIRAIKDQADRVIYFCTNLKKDWQIGLQNELQDRGVRVFLVSQGGSESGLNLQRCLGHLKQVGLGSLLLEGGAHLYARFWEAGMLDFIHHFQAPSMMGHGQKNYFGSQTQRGSDLQMHQVSLSALDPDWLIEAALSKKEF